MPDTVEISELLEIDPTRVDAVGSPANGTEWLMLKALDGSETVISTEDVLNEVVKADDAARPECKTCHGDGKIMGNSRTCPDCKGSGVQPAVGDTEKSLLELAALKEAGVAASGQPVPPADKCPTCKGNGIIVAKDGAESDCPDCGGSGKDAHFPEDDALNRVDGDPGSIVEGDAKGRETVDKAIDPNVGGGVDRDKLPAEDFAGKDRSFPIVTQADVSDALQSIGRAGSDNYSADQLRANIASIAKRKGFTMPDASKAVGDVVEKDGMVSGMNPMLGATATTAAPATDDDADDVAAGPGPGSPEWEGIDADTATAAAMALMEAAELIRTFAMREAIEVAAGEGNDVFDTGAAEMAMCDVAHALGIMAQMAFHEGMAAQKGLVEKQNKRLSGKSVTSVAQARDVLTQLLGDDDPSKSDDDDADDATKKFIDNANKAILSKEIDDMTADELLQLLDERDAQKAAKSVKKGKSKMDQMDSVANAKDAKNKADMKDPKADDDDLEDEADQGDNDSASSPAKGAAKAALTEEEIEANEVAKKARKELKVAKKAKKQATKNAAITKALEESKAEAEKAVQALEARLIESNERLATVEKMAAPTTISRIAPKENAAKSGERNAQEIRIATLENEMRNTSDPAVRAGNREIIKELRASLADEN